MKGERIGELIGIYRDGLLEDTMPFWLEHALDRECGGFLTYLDRDGSALCTDKPVWVAGRFIWILSKLYNTVERKQEWLDAAGHGIDFMLKHAFDSDGRMFFRLTREGKPLLKRRYLFTETFGVIALAEYALASGDDHAKQRAIELYNLLLKYYKTPDLLPAKGFPETRRAKGHAMPMILIATTQVLRQIDDAPLYRQMIDESLNEVFNHFVRPDEEALLETVGPDGERLDSPEGRLVNPGHAIETSWFIMEEGRSRKDDSLVREATTILDWSLKLGWDKQYGGLLSFADVEGKPSPMYHHDMKFWWPHTEALYALLLAHHLTGEDRYAEWYERVHDWTFSHFPDPECGEWYGYLHRDGTVSSGVKGDFWKGPFHIPRAQLYCWKLLEEMQPS